MCSPSMRSTGAEWLCPPSPQQASQVGEGQRLQHSTMPDDLEWCLHLGGESISRLLGDGLRKADRPSLGRISVFIEESWSIVGQAIQRIGETVTLSQVLHEHKLRHKTCVHVQKAGAEILKIEQMHNRYK
ncbi:hypothetical protein NDU88_005927 [Pleurodeles waltl]|uniref:Uncharacterized protein n=1 Tax=Pleurodeles waltl TaxID=8319 RepID=A0AAV7LMP1_PLEWA|nr:hypothetical protein NDU88_005927 [Pleurodeles waltl]